MSVSREMGPKRRRIMDQGPSYYGSPPTPHMYNTTPYATTYAGQLPSFPVVKLRGLPFECTEADIFEFFHNLDIVDVLLVHKGGRFTGDAYCLLGYPLQVEFALQRNMQNMGRRYVEVFTSKMDEYYRAIAKEVSGVCSGSLHRTNRSATARSYDDAKDSVKHTGIIRMKGLLPFSASRGDILRFFMDFKLSDDKVHVIYTLEGKPYGEAFVEFSGPVQSKAAMSKDRMILGKRYVELFPSNRHEMDEAIAMGRSDDEESIVHTGMLRMRGLPFSAGKDDIIEFFRDFSVVEEYIVIIYKSDGRPTGKAYVEFAGPQESEAAIAKDMKMLGSRYIELFPLTHQELNEALAKRR